MLVVINLAYLDRTARPRRAAVHVSPNSLHAHAALPAPHEAEVTRVRSNLYKIAEHGMPSAAHHGELALFKTAESSHRWDGTFESLYMHRERER